MFSLIFPVYNESSCLEKNIKKTMNYLNDLKIKYEIIIAEDGSTDNTYRIASSLAKKYKKVRCSHYSNRLGRGLALKRAFSLAKGNIVGYMDIDLATDLRHLKELINYTKNHDIVTGSRYLKKSKAKRTIERRIFSYFYNFMVRLFLGSTIHDHQCGFKAFKKDVAMKLNKIVRNDGWFWDTEILVIAQKYGYKVKEFPVIWKERENSKVNISKDIKEMGANLFKLYFRLFFE